LGVKMTQQHIGYYRPILVPSEDLGTIKRF
jgi:hypothetical protein